MIIEEISEDVFFIEFIGRKEVIRRATRNRAERKGL
jgi:hypothetical protein